MADYQYVKSTGTIVPDTGDILSDVQTEFKNAFGNDIIVTSDTPQGVLIAAETRARDAVVRNNAALANQINPNLAGGVFLDAVCALTDLQRAKATRSLVTATLSGVAGTVVQSGVRAQTTNGDIFISIQTVTIGSGGTANAIFRAEEYGPIGAAPGSLTEILDVVLGWDAITNAGAATLGKERQSDQSLRALRRVTLADQGVALPEAITSALYKVEGVKSLKFRENVTNATATIDGVSLVDKSIYVCIDGGADGEIAAALLENKSLGCNWNGGVTVNRIDPVSGQTYVVKFARPVAKPIYVRVYVKSFSVLVDPIITTKAAIMAYVNGELENEPGFVVGEPVSPFELAGAINRQDPEIYVQKLEVSSNGGTTYTTNEIPIAISEIATLNPLNINVNVI